ncbi:ABC transporter permease [Reichenbachiella agarivorans]|uniref:ABC transporter permease n=1 Tax=Reichenbachiella agarivorans TaxID=2979464 RepID=A0ABY6CXV4_9BACT|nr:ABC transporter permease [Reichenbachiella agarivorans]UXP33045.1 ABC transporter permease [Reichenbachiella agarivorans]
MQRLIATLIKELKLLAHDRTGMTVLFVMPMMLVIIMTVIQNEAYKSLNESGIPVLLVNHDIDSLGIAIEKGFAKNPMCDLTIDRGERFDDVDKVRERVLQGEYLVALIIPKGATERLRSDLGDMMDSYLDGDSVIQVEQAFTEIHFEIITDPLARESFVMAMSSGLKEVVASIKTKVFFQIVTSKINGVLGSTNEVSFPDDDFFVFKETNAAAGENEAYVPNAVQHNVPAWAIFSIFFIVLPLAGSIISERTTGVFVRMHTFPGSYLSILSGKIVTYIGIALLQFVMVLALGKFVLPWMGLPVLYIGEHWAALLALTLSVSVTAVGYGFLIGTVFDTPQQSAIFGGISVLIMSALGGIWVPLNIMPEHMQQIANISPLNWALKGYYELFIKSGDWYDIQWQVLKLTLFFVFSVSLSYYFHKIKRRTN